MPYVPNAFLGVKNDDASPKQVTITAQTTSASTGSLAGTLTISNIVVSVPAGEERQIGVPAAYSNAGTISITYDAVTSLTVAAQYAKV